MNLDFLSGLLLTAVALAVVVFVVKEIVSDGGFREKTARQRLAEVFGALRGDEAKPVNDHLIGETGHVVEHSDDSARPMTVRLSLELWPARPGSTEEGELPVGTAVRVTAVDGPVLVVVADSKSA